jgi:uncharacterized protein (TIGR03435 family)
MAAGRLLIFAAALLMWAQDGAGLRCEVASVKPVDPPKGPHGVALRVSHGTMMLDAATLRQMVGHAYGVQRVRVLMPPGSNDSAQWDVMAKAQSPDASLEQIRQMILALLAERFKLVAHRERRQMAMYALTVGKNGPALRESSAESGDFQDRAQQMTLRKTPMLSLAALLANILDSPVEDRTGLNGLYDFRLEWRQEDVARSKDATGAADPRDFIPGAVERLGLKLEARREAIELVVVDRAEPASGN